MEFPQVLTSLHNNVFAHSTVTNYNQGQLCVTKGLGQINIYSELINTINTYRGQLGCSPVGLEATPYQIRGTKLHTFHAS